MVVGSALAQTPADSRNQRPDHPQNLEMPIPLPFIRSLPPEAYANRGDPESLLSTSSEVVNFDFSTPNMLTDLSRALTHEPPSQMIANCSITDPTCKQAVDMALAAKINVIETGKGDTIALVYEHTEARDCDARYVNNASNDSNLNHPAFGCAFRANTVQMVTNKKQFTHPGLLDFRDGEKTEQNYDTYLTPPPPPAQEASQGLSQSLTSDGR